MKLLIIAPVAIVMGVLMTEGVLQVYKNLGKFH